MRQSAPFVIVFGIILLLWVVAVPKEKSFFEFLGWMGSAGAAVFAAVSAQATLQTVREMRRAHVEERRPELTLDPGADYFTLSWPDTTAAAGEETHPRYNTHDRVSGETRRRTPFLLVENFGGGAALDLDIKFECIDHAEAAPPVIPSHYARVPHGSRNGLIFDPVRSHVTLRTPGSSFLDVARRSHTVFVPHCGPGVRRAVDVPRPVLWWLALRALEESVTRGFLALPPRRMLDVTITSRSAAAGARADRYRFSVRLGVHPDAVNGPPEVIWEDVESGELRVSFEFLPEPRPT